MIPKEAQLTPERIAEISEPYSVIADMCRAVADAATEKGYLAGELDGEVRAAERWAKICHKDTAKGVAEGRRIVTWWGVTFAISWLKK